MDHHIGNNKFPPLGNSSLPMSNGGQSGNMNAAGILVSDYILLSTLSSTIILALRYSILGIIRPIFRSNKLNRFPMNVCMTSILLSGVMMSMNLMKLMNTSDLLLCRVRSYLSVMAACPMMYSHSVVAVGRWLTIVYSNKHSLRSIVCIWISILVCWLIAFLLAIPFLILDRFACSGSSHVLFLPYYTLIVAMCNIRILSCVRRSSRRVHIEDRAKNTTSQARDVRLIKTMLVTFTIFVEQVFSAYITIPRTADMIFQVLPPFMYALWRDFVGFYQSTSTNLSLAIYSMSTSNRINESSSSNIPSKGQYLKKIY